MLQITQRSLAGAILSVGLLLLFSQGKEIFRAAASDAGVRAQEQDHTFSIAQRDLIEAARFGDLERILALLRLHPRLDASTALGMALKEGHVAIVRPLLDAGADPNATVDLTAHGTFTTVLGLAAAHGDMTIVDMLLDAGAQVNPKLHPGGATPLFTAVMARNLAAVERLLEAGARADRPGYGRSTPLHALVRQDECNATTVAIAERLLAAGANADATDDEGQTVTELAREAGHQALIDAIQTSRRP